MLVFITETAIKVPRKYEPPSPRNTDALGKLNIRNVETNEITPSIKKARSLLPFK